MTVLSRKTPRLYMHMGLQCGLSGDLVPDLVTIRLSFERETAVGGNAQ